MIKIKEICRMKGLCLHIFISFLFATNVYSQKLKPVVVKKLEGNVYAKEEYSIIKRGKDKGKRHGLYTYSKFSREISGNYRFDKKHGRWFLHEYGVVEYYSNGVLDSTLTVEDSSKIIGLSQTDTLMHNVLYPNGYQFDKIKDTLYIYKSEARIPVGKIVDGKKEGDWTWETKEFLVNGQFSADTRVGSHKTYYENGQLLCSITFDELGNEDGLFTIFYPNGNTASIQSYTAGELEGTVKSWYPNGQLCYTATFEDLGWTYYQEFFEDGAINKSALRPSKKSNISSTSFSPPSSIYYDCFSVPELFPASSLMMAPFMTKAEFPGGDVGLNYYIAKNMTYPQQAIKNSEQGVIQVVFTVNLIGRVENVSILNPKDISYTLQAEAIRLIKASSFYWTPATQNGFPVKMQFRLPINFTLY
jgi:TonB family protein|tara:strand:- start:534 stop:1784 length:1251 start_codon:yes stop_codon:yes gene_type:complete